MTDLQSEVAIAADQTGAHATAPALLLVAQTALGRLADSATQATELGRRPFRAPPDWAWVLGELCRCAYLLADQTGVDLDAEVRLAISRSTQSYQPRRASMDGADWI